MKVCTTCGISQPLENYSRKKVVKSGLEGSCRSCLSIRCKAWREKNKEANKARRIVFREANRETLAARSREWHNKNRDKAVERMRSYDAAHIDERSVRNKEWRKNNPEWIAAYSISPQVRAKTTRRRVAKLNATAKWANHEEILQIYADADYVSRLTGVEHSVDHVIPLRGKHVCGLHVETNLAIITAVENSRKHNKFDVFA